MRTRKSILFVAVIVSALMSQPGTVSSEPETIVALGEAVMIEAEVVGVDRMDRTLLLLLPDESVVAVEVGDAVENFDGIMVGDKVRAKYFEAVALYVDFHGEEPEEGAALTAVKASTGDASAAVVVETVDVCARVWKTDHSKRTLMIKMHDGSVRTVTVPEGVEIYPRLKKGDVVHLRHTEAIAVAVTPY